MSSIIVRFPDGTKEFRYPANGLKEGDLVWHEDQRYRVLAITEDGGPPSATLELDSDSIGDVLSSERGSIQLVPID